MDLLHLTLPPRPETPVVATLDVSGALGLADAHASSTLPAPVREDLSHHELSSPRAPWHLGIQQLFLFSVSVLEQPLATPGVNDPVHLYGTLFGPVDALGPLPGVRGQLTVTRADVLSGLVQGAAHAFATRGAGGAGRCFHMLLPGGNDAETAQGRALILAYPLPPAELGADDVSNELLVSQLLCDLLGAVQLDLRAEKRSHPLANTVLPCPSRPALVAELQSRGYTVKGDTAVRNRGAGGGMLTSMFGALTADKLALPPQGSVADFLELARASLSAFEGWPSTRAQHLARHVGLRNASPSVPRTAPADAPATSPYAPPNSTPTPQVDFSRGPQDWMQDFMTPARGTPRPATRVTVARPAHAPAPSPPPATAPGKPAWMDDFSGAAPAPAATPQAPPRAAKSAPQAPKPAQTTAGSKDKPDWLKDFE